MFSVLQNLTYRRLFTAQLVALLGTGLATVALGFKAFELAGDDAGTVLGTALAIRMLACVGITPVANALANRVPRRPLLAGLDLFRVLLALLLPFVTDIWQIYLLIFLLQAASATFTPTFQACIPDLLNDEKAYTQALSLSRLAYDLESIVSPILAALLLSLVSASDLFNGTALGFAASALLLLSIRLPSPAPSHERSFRQRLTLGGHIFLATPRLQGLLALNLVVACASAMVIVNTVVLVQGRFGLDEQASAWAFAAFGLGSISVALGFPLLSEKHSLRTLMLSGGALAVIGLMAGALIDNYAALLTGWCLLGAALSLIQTPAGQLIRCSAHAADRPALFAAQFALSHSCWLFTYPLTGWLGAQMAWPEVFMVIAAVALVALLLALKWWPSSDLSELWHRHESMPVDDPHWQEGEVGEMDEGRLHRHHYVIDEKHPVWPR